MVMVRDRQALDEQAKVSGDGSVYSPVKEIFTCSEKAETLHAYVSISENICQA